MILIEKKRLIDHQDEVIKEAAKKLAEVTAKREEIHRELSRIIKQVIQKRES